MLLILQFIFAALCTWFQQTFNVSLVDIFPASPSTAIASSNITRCALSAVVVAVLQPLVDVMGEGKSFTVLAILSGGGGLVTNCAINSRGMQWRRARILAERNVSERAQLKPRQRTRSRKCQIFFARYSLVLPIYTHHLSYTTQTIFSPVEPLPHLP